MITLFFIELTKENISPHDVSFPLSPASYPQSSLTLDHGETLQNYFHQKCSLFPLQLQVSFIVSSLFAVVSVFFLFCWFTPGFSLLFAVVCDVSLHVDILPMFTSLLMHILAQRFGVFEIMSALLDSIWGFI